MPAISFDAINEIQRQKMLTGQEGWGEYTSGWHKGLAGVIKKLMAYAPVRLLSPEIVNPERRSRISGQWQWWRRPAKWRGRFIRFISASFSSK